MITKELLGVVDELGEVLEDHDLSIDDALLALLYMAAETLKQHTNAVPDKELAADAAKEMLGMYMLLCHTSADSANITVQ